MVFSVNQKGENKFLFVESQSMKVLSDSAF